ncbi:hypothetical protein HBI73_190500 [Parastagonospora nodorum]|nr:hypothetical protein HBI13_114610 [Parastagonospora nodorum]KAH4373811.1 hypothetical protein HBH97_125810 [Parastagonospora nodorum]KAH4598862.1 hypothetical protein HBH82_213800 [Parastagonospora nodorum]KAH4680576.1 hypothetical protein HBH78_133490 [Parastagonospora nodorum]KAH4694861.1 hypothetical protein HBH67_208260 [Parastagonospora nodorum]
MPTSRTSALRTPRRGSAPLGRQFERARAIDSPSASTREVASELWGQAIHLIAHPCAVGLGRVYIQSRRRAAQSLEVPLYMMRMCSLRGNASCEGAMNS